MVSIIIVTYNGMQWLDKCLASCGEYPVIVVDNASTDDTVSFIETNYPRVTLFKQTTNLGFGQANNIGISYALSKGAEQVFLLNQDAYLIDDCLEKLIVQQRDYPEYGVLSPIHFNGAGNKLDCKFILYLNRYKVNEQLMYNYFTNNINNIYPIAFVNAAGWLISRKCIEHVGGFDPLFFHYGEDRNYCQRVLFHKFKIAVVGDAHMQHDRENRVESVIEPFSKKYYEEFVRYAKVEWADVNRLEFSDKFEAYCKAQFRKAIKQVLYLNISQAKNILVKRKLLLELKVELIRSREENLISKASHL